MITHPIFPLEALLADGAGVGLLIRVGQPVAVQVVDVSEGLSTGFTGVILPHLVRIGIGIWILLQGPNNNNSCLDGLRWCSHGYSCRGNGHRDRLALLVGVLTGLGEGLRSDSGERKRRRLWGQGEVEEGERDCLLLHSSSLASILLFPAGSGLHLDARVHGLVPPQVVAVLELLVAGGTDVGWPARFGERFDR